MKMRSIGFVAILSLAAFGCKKTGGGDCGKAIANSMEVSKADMAKMPGVDDKMIAKMMALGVQHCTDDKWSEAVVTCMAQAKTQTEAQGCYGKLTDDQRTKMQKATMEMMTPPAGGAGGSGAAMGGDPGAAGAGSAPAAAAGAAPGAADVGSGSAGSAAAPK